VGSEEISRMWNLEEKQRKFGEKKIAPRRSGLPECPLRVLGARPAG